MALPPSLFQSPSSIGKKSISHHLQWCSSGWPWPYKSHTPLAYHQGKRPNLCAESVEGALGLCHAWPCPFYWLFKRASRENRPRKMSVSWRLMLQRDSEFKYLTHIHPHPSVHSVVRSSCFFRVHSPWRDGLKTKRHSPVVCLLGTRASYFCLQILILHVLGANMVLLYSLELTAESFPRNVWKLCWPSLSTDSGWNPPSMILIKTLLSNEEPKQTYTTMAPGQLR